VSSPADVNLDRHEELGVRSQGGWHIEIGPPLIMRDQGVLWHTLADPDVTSISNAL
jgi:hypothetical protein